MLLSSYKGVPPPPHRKIENKALPESRQAAARTSRLVNLVFSPQTGFFECEHPFIDKPMIITEVTVPSARLFRSLGSKLYLSNKQRMLNKDLAKNDSAGGRGGEKGGESGYSQRITMRICDCLGCYDSYSLRFDSLSIIAFRFRLFRFDYLKCFLILIT